MPSSGRVFVSASLEFRANGNSWNEVSCRLNIALVPNPTTPMDAQFHSMDLEAGRDGVLSMVGSAPVSPGTYYVNVTCWSTDYWSGGPTGLYRILFVKGNVLAWAVTS